MAKTWGGYIKKQFRRAKKVVKKRYVKKGGGAKWGQIMKDISFLKGIVNAEKKRNLASYSGLIIGQCNANVLGAYFADFTPNVNEGDTYGTREGSSLKMHSSFYKFNFYQNTSTTSPIKMIGYLFQVLGAPQTASSFISNIFTPNGFTGIVDYNSLFNPDYRGQYRILRKWNMYLRPDNFSGQTVEGDYSLGIKYNRGKGHHIRFNADTNTVIDGQIIFMIFADNGNTSGSTVSTLSNIPIKAINTGVIMNINRIDYYFDN